MGGAGCGGHGSWFPRGVNRHAFGGGGGWGGGWWWAGGGAGGRRAGVDREADAEAFDARYARLVVTAADEHWLNAAVTAVTGYGASVIGCDAEVGVERRLSPDETRDGRPGAAIMANVKRRANMPKRWSSAGMKKLKASQN